MPDRCLVTYFFVTDSNCDKKYKLDKKDNHVQVFYGFIRKMKNVSFNVERV